MTLSDLGSLGEFISSVAVVVSLVYLAQQVRRNSRETRLASRQRVLEQGRDLGVQLATREVSALMVKADKDRESLDEAEAYQYSLVRAAQLRNIENAFLVLADGVIDSDVFEIFAFRARQLKRLDPDFVANQVCTNAFKAWIDQLDT